jgi:hypothetical protein
MFRPVNWPSSGATSVTSDINIHGENNIKYIVYMFATCFNP